MNDTTYTYQIHWEWWLPAYNWQNIPQFVLVSFFNFKAMERFNEQKNVVKSDGRRFFTEVI